MYVGNNEDNKLNNMQLNHLRKPLFALSVAMVYKTLKGHISMRTCYTRVDRASISSQAAPECWTIRQIPTHSKLNGSRPIATRNTFTLNMSFNISTNTISMWSSVTQSATFWTSVCMIMGPRPR